MTDRAYKRKMAIRRYWASRIDLARKGFMDEADFIEGEDVCFACGLNWEYAERCHITPRCEGGSDGVENLHILCWVCHKDSEIHSGEKYWKWFYGRDTMDAIISRGYRCGSNVYSDFLVPMIEEMGGTPPRFMSSSRVETQ
jgi:hypothetical protein